MQYKKLGNTGLLVSEICLGTMTFGGQGMWKAIGQVGQSDANKLIERAVAEGVNFFDTANVYSEGESETILGQGIKDLNLNRENLILATKVRGRTGEGPNEAGLSRKHIFTQVKDSLKRLQTDYIDLYQVHGYDPVTPLEETLGAMDDLVRQGLVRYTGCSNMAAWQIMKAAGIAKSRGYHRFESLQAYYTIAGRDLEREIVPLLNDQKMGLMVWSPLAGGLLSGKFKRGEQAPEGARRASFDFPPVNMDRFHLILNVVEQIARLRGVSPARVSLSWLLAKPHVSSVIIGAKTLEQLTDNLDAAKLFLSEEELGMLDKSSEITQEYPGWMLERMMQDRFKREPSEPRPLKSEPELVGAAGRS